MEMMNSMMDVVPNVKEMVMVQAFLLFVETKELNKVNNVMDE